jgi:hypothetical protein
MDSKYMFFRALGSRPRPSPNQIIRSGSSVDSSELYELLSIKSPADITHHDLRNVVEGKLWMLTPEAFRYFLPAFLHAALAHYGSLSIFASELIGALTAPSRIDVEKGLDRMVGIPAGLGLPDDMAEIIRKQQLEWFDTGAPSLLFHERFDNLTDNEGAAILAFLIAFKKDHDADFPFGELDVAIERFWSRYDKKGRI